METMCVYRAHVKYSLDFCVELGEWWTLASQILSFQSPNWQNCQLCLGFLLCWVKETSFPVEASILGFPKDETLGLSALGLILDLIFSLDTSPTRSLSNNNFVIFRNQYWFSAFRLKTKKKKKKNIHSH